MYVNRKEEEEGETEQQLQSYQFAQGYITHHRLQGHHLTLNFNIYNLYIMSIIYIHKNYELLYSQRLLLHDTINIIRVDVGTYKEE